VKAITGRSYGSPEDVLRLEDVDPPAPEAGRVLLRVRAASVTAYDWRILGGKPFVLRPLMGGLLRPKEIRRGHDVAGVVESVGEGVTRFAPGDEVCGAAPGAFAETASAREAALVHKPARLSFEQAACFSNAGLTALQAIRKGGLEAGQKVLLNGAGGGVGSFATQLVKILGGELTAVCGPRNVDIVRSLGADRVVDYSRDDFTKLGGRYDLILDNAGTVSIRRLARLLEPNGTLVIVGAVKNPIGHVAMAHLQNVFTRRRRLTSFITKFSDDDLQYLASLAEEGKLTPVIDRTYPLAETAAAYRYVLGGHVCGKVVITV
jgi:NADPH:quinone reductase-like Zn-dependent oxidoreductase